MIMNKLSTFFEEFCSKVMHNDSTPVKLIIGDKELYANYSNLKDYCGTKSFEQQINVKFGNKGIETILSPEKKWNKTIRTSNKNFTEKDYDSLKESVEKFLNKKNISIN